MATSLSSSLQSGCRRIVALGILGLAIAMPGKAAAAESDRVALPDHMLPALAQATPLPDEVAAEQDAKVTLTVVLQRTDAAGFARYLGDLYDPGSPAFRRYLNPVEVADRFGRASRSTRRSRVISARRGSPSTTSRPTA